MLKKLKKLANNKLTFIKKHTKKTMKSTLSVRKGEACKPK
jgi:hypothetical protein